jgi:hypothetical protein
LLTRMTAETNHDAPTLDDDLNTTAPQSTPAVWKMPDPIFRKTSGRLPQGFEREYFDEPDTAQSPRLAADIDPNPTPHIEPKPKSQTQKIILVLLGVAAMVAFIALFLTVLYFMFLR